MILFINLTDLTDDCQILKGKYFSSIWLTVKLLSEKQLTLTFNYLFIYHFKRTTWPFGSLCNLLRWGAIDAEVYPEASKDIIGILFAVGTSTCPSHDLQWTKAKASAFDALAQYEVKFKKPQNHFSSCQ